MTLGLVHEGGVTARVIFVVSYLFSSLSVKQFTKKFTLKCGDYMYISAAYKYTPVSDTDI